MPSWLATAISCAASSRRPRAGPIVAVPGLGGSIPMYLFEEILKTSVVGVPIANHDNNSTPPTRTSAYGASGKGSMTPDGALVSLVTRLREATADLADVNPTEVAEVPFFEVREGFFLL